MTTYRKFFQDRDRFAFATDFDDFHKYAAGDWTLTTVEAGAGSATEALGAGVGGLLVVTTDAADNDNDFYQRATESFKFVSGKALQFVMRFKLSRVDGDFMAGLHITDTDPIGGVSDGIYFRKLAAEAGLSLVVEKDAAESAVVSITTLAADTWYIVEFYYDGSDDKIKAYVNGIGAGSVPLTNAPNDEDLALSFGVQNGSANAQILTVDFVGAQQER
jgi:hypothetical protein